MNHRTHFTNPLLFAPQQQIPSFYELIDGLTNEETVMAARQYGLNAVRENIYNELDLEIFRRGVGHMDEEVPTEIFVLYEEFVVSLREKNPELEVTAL